MPLQSPDQLQAAIEQGRLGGVFFLFGDEGFLKEEAVRRIVDAHIDPATRDFNLDQLRGGEVTPEQLASIAQTPPMMAEWRVIIVRDGQALAGSATLRAAVESLLTRAVPGLALILLAELPPRSKARFYETLKRSARAAEFSPLALADLPGWLMAYARTRGVALEPDAARALPAAVGTDLGVLVSELEKLRDYVGERASIVTADVEAAVGPIARENRWDWFDRVGDLDFRDARASLPVLLESTESGVGLVIGLGTHLLRLAIAVAGGERALADALPPPQKWLVRRIAGQARGWSAVQLDAALDDLLRADRLLKSASLDDRQVLEETLLRMEARARRAA
ncbi:MAG: DNA polymerase III subunit delta [Longimicrobiales bacterium]